MTKPFKRLALLTANGKFASTLLKCVSLLYLRNSIKNKYVLHGLLGLSFIASATTQAQLITDLVEPNDGWIVTGNSLHFLTATNGTSPTAGMYYLHIQNRFFSSGIGGRDASKTFTGHTLVPGSYTVTFDIGNFDNAPFAEIYLSQTGLTANGTVLTPVTSVTPIPPDPGISTWTLNYEIPSGHPNLGQTLGFQLIAPDLGVSQNASFDNLIISLAQTDILEPPATSELEEEGTAWTHPLATVSGEGELKIEDSSASIDLVVEGDISCDVSLSAPADADNRVEIESEDGGSDVEAKSDVGGMAVNNCTSNGVLIVESIALTGAKVKVEIEEFRTNSAGDLVFSEYEAEGKVASGENPRVELELENGMMAIIATTPPSPPPDSGGGGGGL